MEDLPKTDRTWLCSVVFVDVVEYSVQSVALQASWKDRLNRYLGIAIQDVPESDRVILDTGDGAAICFLGDPEAAMFCGLRLLGALIEDEPKRDVPMRARLGINLGPVKLVRDINGNVNAIGDGINVGQRVMSFAGDNQILVSRSFYEVVSCLSETHVDLFRYLGVRRDKHVREHTVYELLPPGARAGAAAKAAEPWVADEVHAALAPEFLEAAEGCLAEFVGPVAGLLLRRAGAAAATTEALLEAVLPHVPAASQAAFLAAWRLEVGGTAAVSTYTPAAGTRTHVPTPRTPTPALRTPTPASRTPTPAPRAPTPAPRAPTPPPGLAPTLAEHTIQRVRDEAAEIIGPVARLLIGRAVLQAQSEQELYDLVSEQMASPAERERFLEHRPPD